MLSLEANSVAAFNGRIPARLYVNRVLTVRITKRGLVEGKKIFTLSVVYGNLDGVCYFTQRNGRLDQLTASTCAVE